VKMNKARRNIISMLFTAILIGSCAGQPPASPTPDVNAIMTQGVGTFVASVFGTQTAMATPATPTPLDTPTFIPTSTPQALPSPFASPTFVFLSTVVAATATGTQYTVTPNQSTLAYGCNNLTLINDRGNSPEDVQPRENFTHTWQVANSGSCDWLYGYRLVPVGGDNLAEDPVRVTNPPVPPGEWRQLSVRLSAPNHSGTFTQSWRLTDGAGHAFGSTLTVSITVEEPTSTYP
jgi:hypothetical protein